MPDRHHAAVNALPEFNIKIASALRKTFKAGYKLSDFGRDILAGIVVGIIALPLSMALAIASGVPPQHGIYTAIVAGGLIALLGGSAVQVSGPTAAFVVILSPIAATYGLGGLLIATMMAGLLLIAAGLARLGRLIEFIPYPVTTGFTAGIAVVIATLQLRDFLGLKIAHMPDHFIERACAIGKALPTLGSGDLAIGLVTLFILIVLPRFTKVIPAALVALPVGALLAYLLQAHLAGFHADTIQSRFSYELNGVHHAGIPQLPPIPQFPWDFPGPKGQPLVMSLGLIQSLIGSAFAIAMLGAIESLLSAVVSDGMTGSRHDPDAELVAQGIGNVMAPFFGGIAATGAIARTATNVRCGARSPIAAMTHAVFLLLAVVILAPLLGYLPMASMAALLFIVAWNMSEAKHFVHVLRVAPKSDVFVLLTCFGLTVVFDMVISVGVGVVLAALLFMRRMSEVSSVKLVDAHPMLPGQKLPPGVMIYEIAGPLFFGAAQKAMSSLRVINRGIKTVILDLASVPVMDATGLVNLESAMEHLRKSGVYIIIGGVNSQPLSLLTKSGLNEQPWLAIHETMEEAVRVAWLIAE
jgi:SulP family sulfate permease